MSLEDARAGRILNASVSGARWILGLSLLTTPITYGTNVLLGRMDPELLGTYGLMVVLSQVISGFFLLGGGHAFVRFLPRLAADGKLRFTLTYAAIVAVAALGFLVLFRQLPLAQEVLLGGQAPGTVTGWLAVLTPIVLILYLGLSILQAEMRLSWAAVGLRLAPVLVFTMVAVLFLGGNLLVGAAPGAWIVWSFMAAHAVAALVILSLVLRVVGGWLRSASSGSGAVYLPTSFWRFTLLTHAGTVVLFVLDNFDQLLIVGRLSIEDLGLYRMALASSLLVRWAPLLLTQTLFPTFANLTVLQDRAHLGRLYQTALRYTALVASSAALALVSLSPVIVWLFGGARYRGAQEALVLLAAASTLYSIITISTSLILAEGHAGAGAGIGALGAAGQVVVSLALIGVLGLNGAAWGRVAAAAILTAAHVTFLRARLGLLPSRSVGWIVSGGLAAMALWLAAYRLAPSWWPLWSAGVLALFPALLWVSGAFVREHYASLLRFALGRAPAAGQIP